MTETVLPASVAGTAQDAAGATRAAPSPERPDLAPLVGTTRHVRAAPAPSQQRLHPRADRAHPARPPRTQLEPQRVARFLDRASRRLAHAPLPRPYGNGG